MSPSLTHNLFKWLCLPQLDAEELKRFQQRPGRFAPTRPADLISVTGNKMLTKKNQVSYVAANGTECH